jgi:hypothetical protein
MYFRVPIAMSLSISIICGVIWSDFVEARANGYSATTTFSGSSKFVSVVARVVPAPEGP